MNHAGKCKKPGDTSFFPPVHRQFVLQQKIVFVGACQRISAVLHTAFNGSFKASTLAPFDTGALLPFESPLYSSHNHPPVQHFVWRYAYTMSNGEENETTAPLLQDTDGTSYGSVNDAGLTSPEGLALIVSEQQQSVLQDTTVQELARKIGCTSFKQGLTSSQVPKQRDKYGSNQVSLPPKPSLLELVVEELKDATIVMLLASAFVSLLLGWNEENGWIEGTSIIVTVCLVVSLSASTDYIKAKEFRQQQVDLENEKHVYVVRDGNLVQIHPRDLVVGDVIRLAVGDICPVDGILVDGSLKMDESALTGEAKLIDKAVNDDPFIISGTNVMQGEGKLLVLAVGNTSMQGKILKTIREQEEGIEEKEEGSACANLCSFGAGDDGADLMEKLDIMAVDIGKVGLLVAMTVFVVLVGTWSHAEFVMGGKCAKISTEDECETKAKCAWSDSAECDRVWVTGDMSTVLEFFITAVTILVVAVPEGLPLAVTLALAVSIRRMIKDNNQVKHLDSCETMGSATTICSDKTGTLTENKMTVMRAHVADQEYEYNVGKGNYDNLGAMMQGNDTMTRLLSESILLNCNTTSKVVETETGIKYEGNSTECALIKLSMQLGYQADAVREDYKEKDSMLDWGVYNIPFSSERKRMSWIVHGKCPGTYRLYCKGAPKQLLDLCDFLVGQITNEVEVLSLTAADRNEFLDIAEGYQKDGLRTLAVAFREFDKEPKGGWDKQSWLESSLTLLTIFGIEDPLRPSVPGAISDCRKAGIDVRMCTGDALDTAIAIAKGCGILRSTDLDENGHPKSKFAMTGAEFDDRVHLKDSDKPKIMRRVFDPEVNDSVEKLAEQFKLDSNGNKVLDQAAFDQVWPTLRVLARCQPEDKLALVRGMRQSKVFMDNERCTQLLVDHGIRIFPDYQVVAVTGDGTNDAPALKSADVGFAMGIVGTETAKQACDIILLDDNFASIVKAVMWGRNVFDSISKFLQFQLTVNIVAISLATLGAFVYDASPLSAVQMLW